MENDVNKKNTSNQKRYVWFKKDNHNYKIEVKNDKHYQKLKFRFEQRGYVEIPEPPEEEGTYTC